MPGQQPPSHGAHSYICTTVQGPSSGLSTSVGGGQGVRVEGSGDDLWRCSMTCDQGGRAVVGVQTVVGGR